MSKKEGKNGEKEEQKMDPTNSYEYATRPVPADDDDDDGDGWLAG